jgi:glycosyltransferase involved in cell wall biosynthesis
MKISVLIPCYNEAAAIAKVVGDFQTTLPDAEIYVYDNNSTDRSAELAREAGATVFTEPLQGKGNVVRRMFADIDADIYVLVDGDDTYDASCATELIDNLVAQSLDMVNTRRVTELQEAFRPGHRLGNAMLTTLVARIFGNRFSDLLSGYRVLSRRFVKSFPALARGFEIETELTVHALELRMPVTEVPCPYRARPAGSVSKLSTFGDGLRILRWIFILVKEERPLPFFSSIFFILALVSVALAWPIVLTYLDTGLVPRFPTAILSTGLMLLAFLSLACGLILDTVTRGRKEMKRLQYLAVAGIASLGAGRPGIGDSRGTDRATRS